MLDIRASDCLWSRVSPENLVFSAILVHGGAAVERHINIILEILVKQLDPAKEPEVRLNLFTLLSDVLGSYGSLGSHQEKLDNFVTTIVEGKQKFNLYKLYLIKTMDIKFEFFNFCSRHTQSKSYLESGILSMRSPSRSKFMPSDNCGTETFD